MLLSLKSRFVGNVYVIECVGRIVLGEEVKALEAALELAEREFTQIVLNLSEVNRLDSRAAAGRAAGVRYEPAEYDEALHHAAELSDGGRRDRVFSERNLRGGGAGEAWTPGAAV